MHACVLTFKGEGVICKKSTKEFSYMSLPYVRVRTELSKNAHVQNFQFSRDRD